MIAVFAVGILIVAAGNSTAPSGSPLISISALRQDAAAQADLGNALNAEKVHDADTRRYSADAATMLQIEPGLLWNRAGGLQVFVSSTIAADHVRVREEGYAHAV